MQTRYFTVELNYIFLLPCWHKCMQIKAGCSPAALMPNQLTQPPKSPSRTQIPASVAPCTWHVLWWNRSPKLSFRLTRNPLFSYFFSRFSGLPQINFSIPHTDLGGGGRQERIGLRRRCRSRSRDSVVIGSLHRHQLRRERRPIIGDRILQPGPSVLASAGGIRPVGDIGTQGALSGRLRHLQCDHPDRDTRVSALSGKCHLHLHLKPQAQSPSRLHEPNKLN